jgi:hypothetical protein
VKGVSSAKAACPENIAPELVVDVMMNELLAFLGLS